MKPYVGVNAYQILRINKYKTVIGNSIEIEWRCKDIIGMSSS